MKVFPRLKLSSPSKIYLARSYLVIINLQPNFYPIATLGMKKVMKRKFEQLNYITFLYLYIKFLY